MQTCLFIGDDARRQTHQLSSFTTELRQRVVQHQQLSADALANVQQAAVLESQQAAERLNDVQQRQSRLEMHMASLLHEHELLRAQVVCAPDTAVSCGSGSEPGKGLELDATMMNLLARKVESAQLAAQVGSFVF